MCSTKNKEIVELKEKGNEAADRLHTLREEKKGFKAYIDEMDAKWTRRMEKLEISNNELRISNNELRTNNAKQNKEISSLIRRYWSSINRY